MEENILKTLEYRITTPTAHYFIIRALKAAHANNKIVQLSCYLLEGSLLSYNLTRYLPSQLAAAAVLIARHTIGRNSWSPTLVRYTNYYEEEIAPVARVLLAEKAAMSKRLVAVNSKYLSTRYGCVADTVFVSDF